MDHFLRHWNIEVLLFSQVLLLIRLFTPSSIHHQLPSHRTSHRESNFYLGGEALWFVLWVSDPVVKALGVV